MLRNGLPQRLALALACFFTLGMICCACSSSPGPASSHALPAQNIEGADPGRAPGVSSEASGQTASSPFQPTSAGHSKVTLLPRAPRPGETLRVEVASDSPESNPHLNYQWFVNGEENPAWRGDSFAGDFVRGDKISVVVSSPDGNKSEPPLTASVTIGNSPPVVEKLTTPRFDGQTYQTQIVATDPDGDPLAFSIVEAPPGLEIDAQGKITWNPAESDLGKHDVVVSMTDDSGGEIVYTYSFSVDRQ